MPSPFPGMDPYLEDAELWPKFHRHLVVCLHQLLLPSLTARYQADIGQRQYVTEQTSSPAGGPQEHHEEYLEVRQRGDGRLVTLVDVVSPANKTTAAGRHAYLAKRREGRVAGANLVEIDLVLQGQPTLDYSRDNLPDWDYAVTVTRATQPERHEIYTATLQKRLPRFRLPLAAEDRDTVLDLQTTFNRCYDQGNFAALIDYQRDPPTALSDEDRSRVNELLSQGMQRPFAPQPGTGPSSEDVAVAAYYLWQKEGCPHGRDQEYWCRAVEQLKHKTDEANPKQPAAGPLGS